MELLLRATQPQPRWDPRLPYFANLSVDRIISIAGVAEHSRFSTNSLGLRGDEPPQKDGYRILALGGSTTFGIVLDDRHTWPAQLQRQLGESGYPVWVGNAGMDGQTTRGHLLVMSSIVPFIHPNMIVVMAGVNDLGLSLVRLAHTGGVEGVTHNKLLMQSATVRMVMQVNRANMSWIGSREMHYEREMKWIESEDETPILRGDLAAALPTLVEYRTNLNSLIDAAQQMDTDIILVTQAGLYDDAPEYDHIDDTPEWADSRLLHFSARTYARMLSLYNQITLDVCNKRHVRCIDLASLMPHDERYFIDDVHFTDAGADEVATLLKPDIIEEIKASVP